MIFFRLGNVCAQSHADKPRTNRLLTDCQPVILFPHSVYIGFRLYMLLERRSGDVSSMPWRVRGTLVLWANSSVGTQSCPTPRGRPAGRPDSTRPWYVRVLDSTGSIYIGFRLFVLLERRSRDVSSMHWGVRGTLVSWANCSVDVPSCLAPLRRPAVHFDPTRPWNFRVLDSAGLFMILEHV